MKNMAQTRSTPSLEALATVNDLVAQLARLSGDVVPKRADRRYPFNAEVTLGLVNPDGSFEPIAAAWGYDLSCLGIGLLTDHAFERGQELFVQIHDTMDRQRIIPIRIAYCRRLFGHIQRIGARFVAWPV
jgi:hypothetical protein